MTSRFAFTSAAVAAIAVAALWSNRALAPQRTPWEPTTHLAAIDAWAPALAEGRSVQFVRRPCATQQAEYLAKVGEPAPEFVPAGQLRTYGPLPAEKATLAARLLREIADGTMHEAETQEVATLADARHQMQTVLNALKARAAAVAVADGAYWTVARNQHPRVPRHYSYWQMQTDVTGPEGTPLDVFVPLNLRSAELSATYDAVLALESDLRTESCVEFNALAYDERRALCEDAWRAAKGEAVGRSIPEWFWKLEIDHATWLATPLPPAR